MLHVSVRTRSGIAEIKRQRRLAAQAAPVNSELVTLAYLSGQCTTAPVPSAPPPAAAQVLRPAGQISAPLRSNFVVVNHSQSQDTAASKLKFASLKFCF